MPYREKSAWISLLAHFFVFGSYFTAFALDWDQRAASEDHGLGAIVGAVVMLVLLAIVLQILIAIMTPNDANAPEDERERQFALRAANVGGIALATGVIVVIGLLLIGVNGVLAANLLLAALVFGEMARAIAQIVQFRAGA